ncbi:MAG: hypothetical protein WB760_19250 [Xanthobacteraceae bacterium]
MPQLNNKIASLMVKVSDIQNNPSFDVQASEDPVVTGTSPFVCTGFAADADLLQEILTEVMAKFPGQLMSLCIDGNTIKRKVNCAEGAKSEAEAGKPKAGATKPGTRASKPKP